MFRKILAFTALPMVLSCAPFQQATAESLSPTQSSLINGICNDVMGLRKGDVYYFECQDSLTQSLVRKITAESFAAADDTCRARGLASGSSALSVCMLNEENAHAVQSAASLTQPINLGPAASALENGKSFYGVTPSVQWNRERYSCAQLGLPPNSGLFGECVAGLVGAMLPDPN